jgi:hypothetical protein
MNSKFKIHDSNLWAAVILLLTIWCFGTTVFAHKFHTTLTRIDYNEKEKLAEISIQVFRHDLEILLERRTKKHLNLDKAGDLEKPMSDYLSETFVLKNAEGEIKKLKWIGFEQDVDTVLIYVETEMPEGLASGTLLNSMFFESFPEQLNFVHCRFDNKKIDLNFKVGDKSFEITETRK